ncbi:MAG TPA: DNA ligase D [Prolixibacteraceae bacterium]|jgi:bifunctional non-homologous end joining protein LigD|nr:DNA ligase D [Prolixibacteraceae bacterium]
MSLELYKKKRDFKSTPEPEAIKGEKKSVLSFVVQRHQASHLHYDFRLEMEGVLKSWAVPKGPSMVAGERRLAVMVEDHPLPYGEFYGEIPSGNYGAGIVDIWDEGVYLPLEQKGDSEKNLLEQLEKGNIKFVINGHYLKGGFGLVRIQGKEKENEWLLIKKKDEYALDSFNIEQLPAVKSKTGTVNVPDDVHAIMEPQMKNQEQKVDIPGGAIKPMLARLSSSMIDEPDWIYEMKYDGYRLISTIRDGQVEMVSRNGNSFNEVYSELFDELSTIKESVILDGEIVVEDSKGISDFQLLQNYRTTREGKLKYYVFDLLYLNGHWVTDFPLVKRKELLDAFFKLYNFKNIFNAPYQTGKGKALFQKLSKAGYEGIIAKAPDSEYQVGRRSDAWLKVKSVMMQEAIICGYTLPQRSRQYFGSLILGLYDELGQLKFIGNCGTGFNDVSLAELHAKFETLTTTKCPFPKVPKLLGAKGKPIWLKPELVCNVKFAEWSMDEKMRVPVFMGLRVDKEAHEVVNESKEHTAKKSQKLEETMTISGREVKCTNLNKVYWPEEGFTKADLIKYYLTVSKYILPYLKNRPQSLNRHPNGVKGKNFYQKDMDVSKLPSWIKTAKVYSKSNEAYIDYLICNDAATLIYMANMGCIEINPWHSTYLAPDEPTYIMLDLDPGNVPFRDVVDTALAIKEICDEINIPAYCKTSGATGLHIYIPMAAKYSYSDGRTFAQLIATIANDRLPAITSIERSLEKRKEKVYIDYMQNSKSQTIACAYSVRPREMATVSTPLDWKEVNYQLTPQMFTIKNIPDRLASLGDLWTPVLKKGIVIDRALKALEKL